MSLVEETNNKTSNYLTNHLTQKDNVTVSNTLSYTEARRTKEIYNAEIARLTALKEQQLYVEKEKIYKELFEFGSNVRISFEMMSDWLIDNILASKTRSQAHGILANAIHDALFSLTNMDYLK